MASPADMAQAEARILGLEKDNDILRQEYTRMSERYASTLRDVEALFQQRDDILARMAAHQIETGTQIYRQQRALAPILAHADDHPDSAPLRYSVIRCKGIKGEVEGPGENLRGEE